MKVNWSKAKTAYVTSNKSYRDIARQYKIAPSVVSKKGKADGWVEARNEYRAQLAAKSIETSQELELNRLRSLQESAMKMCEELQAALNNKDELYTHVGVESLGMGKTKMSEWKLKSIDSVKARNICQSLQTMTNTMRNLFEIQTKAQQQQLELAREKMQLERERAERDAKDNEDTVYTVEYAQDMERYSK